MFYFFYAFIVLSLVSLYSVFCSSNSDDFKEVYIYILAGGVLAYLVGCYLHYKGYIDLNENLVHYLNDILIKIYIR